MIDWLDDPTPTAPSQRPIAAPPRAEPPVTSNGLAPDVQVAPLDGEPPRNIGLVPASVSGMQPDLWAGSDVTDIVRRIETMPDPELPAAQALLFTVLLAEAAAPVGGATAQNRLTAARVDKLMQLGAIDPARALIEQAGAATSPLLFDLWMQISLLTGDEDTPCGALSRSPRLTKNTPTQIFCAARTGDWDTAALTFETAGALGLAPREKLALLDRFLNPDLFEDASPLPVPRRIDPLGFRLFETIGERLPTGPLPRQFAVADLRDLAGWKSQLEAGERLTRAGALPENLLLGLYTDRKPAASGGIWDRVRAVQRFETALRTQSPDAVAKTLPPVWKAMQNAGLDVTFASLFSAPLQEIALTGTAADIQLVVGLLSPDYETVATTAPDGRQPFARALARGETLATPPRGALQRAIHDAFANPTPRQDLLAMPQQRKTGMAMLEALNLLHEGGRGDSRSLRDALSTLRALGLEDTARRAALQILLSGEQA
ncbi:hypothetical protein [Sulfitobacter sp. S190]|uniref:hypothetical protein n=1 Tax=Sulfitobacter sp. S190 TaxID=2867022 RepID=UPI0021A8E787|nr:hypothetical protein [Sulfitobacter sp. S190]